MLMLQTERLILRQPTKADVQRLFDIYGDPQTNRYNPAGPYPDIQKAHATLQEWLEHWRKYAFGTLVITQIVKPEYVIGFGGASYYSYGNEQKLNLGYRFDTAFWGQGFATESGRAVLDHTFNDLNLPEVYGLVRPDNKPSIHVLEKLGMILVDTLDDVPGKPESLVYRKRKDE
ncbi:MAG: GNAT family N-acetyltransferase [Deinococcota bacterium]